MGRRHSFKDMAMQPWQQHNKHEQEMKRRCADMKIPALLVNIRNKNTTFRETRHCAG